MTEETYREQMIVVMERIAAAFETMAAPPDSQPPEESGSMKKQREIENRELLLREKRLAAEEAEAEQSLQKTDIDWKTKRLYERGLIVQEIVRLVQEGMIGEEELDPESKAYIDKVRAVREQRRRAREEERRSNRAQ